MTLSDFPTFAGLAQAFAMTTDASYNSCVIDPILSIGPHGGPVIHA